MRKGLVVLAATAMVLLGGCGGEEAGEQIGEQLVEKAAEQEGEDVDVDIEGGTVKVETSEGTVEMGMGEWPDSLPGDLPQIEGQVVNSTESPSGAFVAVQVDDASTVFADYVEQLEGDGWTVDQNTDAGTASTAMLSKDGVTVQVIGDSSSNLVSLVVDG